MLTIEYPKNDFRIKREGEKGFIFDELRKQWLPLTPEEWVRQNFIKSLVEVKEYPATLIAQEKKITLGELTKRFDILVYDRNMKPWMMIECKSENVMLRDKVLEQLLRYNISVPVDYLIITNGSQTAGFKKEGGKLIELAEMPLFGT